MKRWIYVASATLAGALLAPAHRAEAASAAPSAAFAPQAAPADLPPNDSAKALIDGRVEVHAREVVALAQHHRLLAAQGPVELDDLARVLAPYAG